MDSTVSDRRIPAAALWIGIAGLVPFAAAGAARFFDWPLLPPPAGLRLGILYGTLILSFLGGIRWGVALPERAPRSQAANFAIGALPILAALSAIFLPDVLALALLICGFLLQALWDVMSAEDGRLPHWFARLRMMLTAGAVPVLIVLLLDLLI